MTRLIIQHGFKTAFAAVLLALAGVAGCTTYQPLPLDQSPPLAMDLGQLRLEPNQESQKNRSTRTIDPENGFDLTEIGMLAVLNSPDLKMQRTRLGIAGAQIFAAGLLPDPQVSAGLDTPTGNSTGLVTAYALGLSYDIVPLINRQARIEAAQQGQQQVRLDLLWQEWQVVAQARSLAVRAVLEQQQIELLQEIHADYLQRYQRSTTALVHGDTTLDINGTDLTALVDVLSQINQLEQISNETRHSLSLLLGLDPQVDLPLAALPQQDWLDIGVVQARLSSLPSQRPDLLALQAGYTSQEANVRAAILAQFPSIGLGVNLARDTAALKTTGINISLNLPLFSGNRGTIALERASREQLREEYRSRLATAVVDVDRLLQLQIIIQRHQGDLQKYLPVLQGLAERANRAYQQGDIDALSYLNMESTWINKRLEQISLEQAKWENRIALDALLAMPAYTELPAAITLHPKEGKP